MNEQFAGKWVAALRSGAYSQTRHLLWRREQKPHGPPPGHCCLGVAADICGIGNWRGDAYEVGLASSVATLPRPVQDAIGLSMHAKEALVLMNDKQRLSFSEIADYIEQNWATM